MTSKSDSDDSNHDQPTCDATTSPTDGALPDTMDGGAIANVESVASNMPQLVGLEEYELLEELGRGGMGVVYRAKHKTLGRAVALKMILAGQFASPESVQRFILEAESAARLDHPGIVPIYEIGKAGENHFYSMKFVDGNPLSESLQDYEPDQRKSATLMVKIDGTQAGRFRGQSGSVSTGNAVRLYRR